MKDQSQCSYHLLQFGCVLVISSRTIMLFLFVCGFSASSHLHAEYKIDRPNFVIGLGYGLLDDDSLVNIDFTINMPINSFLSTQVLLNSNYLVTGATEDDFAQSELSSNWFLNHDYGRLGFGLGFSELEPRDEELETEQELMGQFIGELFIDSFSLSANYISNEFTLSNVTSSRVGMSYYINDDQRVSIYREKYNEDSPGWRLETYFQPKKYEQMGSVGVIVRTGDSYNYYGMVVRYYFDHNVSLKQREMEFH